MAVPIRGCDCPEFTLLPLNSHLHRTLLTNSPDHTPTVSLGRGGGGGCSSAAHCVSGAPPPAPSFPADAATRAQVSFCNSDALAVM